MNLLDYIKKYRNRPKPKTKQELVIEAAEAVVLKRDKKVNNLNNIIRNKDNRIEELNSTIENYVSLTEMHKKMFTNVNSKVGALEKKVNKIELTLSEIPPPEDLLDSKQPDNPTQWELYNSCEKKRTFSCRKEAEIASIKFGKEFQTKFDVYECRYCNLWHLAEDKEHKYAKHNI